MAVLWTFKKFRKLYDNLWKAKAQDDFDELVELWLDALYGISSDEIKYAFNALISGHPIAEPYFSYPPNAIQFQKLCLWARERIQDELRFQNRNAPRLGHNPEINWEKGKQEWTKIKTLLKHNKALVQPLSQQGEGNMVE